MPSAILAPLQRLDSIAVLSRRITRALANNSKKSFWALADQGLVSIGNFGVQLVLARYFDHHGEIKSFGAFWLLMEPMLFLNSLQAGLLIYPLTIRGAVVSEATMGRMLGMAIILTCILAPLLSLGMMVDAICIHVSLYTGFWAAIAMICWQVQELLRRGLMAKVQFKGAVAGDAVSYLGQIAVVLLFARLGRLSIINAFVAMSLTSLAGAIVQARQLRVSFRFTRKQLRKFTRECWKVARWVLGANLTTFLTGPFPTWNIAFWCGDEIVGVAYAMANLLRFANPLSSAISTLIMPHAARESQASGMGAARRVLLRFGSIGALMLLPYLGLLLFAPKLAIAMFYGWSSRYEIWRVLLQIATVSAGLNYLASVSGSMLNAVHRSRDAFVAQCVVTGALLALCIPLTAYYGLIGASTATLVANGVQVIFHTYFITKLPDNDRSGRNEHSSGSQLLPTAGG